jgi:hypothetical protein
VKISDTVATICFAATIAPHKIKSMSYLLEGIGYNWDNQTNRNTHALFRDRKHLGLLVFRVNGTAFRPK